MKSSVKIFLAILTLLSLSSCTPSKADKVGFDGTLFFRVADMPTFEDFLVKPEDRFSGITAEKITRPELFNSILEDSEKTEARLHRALINGPNFAGKYYIAQTKGCGTNCYAYAIINVETGAVIDTFNARQGVHWQLDSRLLIVNLWRNPVESGIWHEPPSMYFYVMQDDYLQLIEKVKEPEILTFTE